MSLAATDIDFLRDLIRKKSGNMVSSDQGYLLETRLSQLAQQEGLAGASDLVKRLRTLPGASLGDRVAETMTINETSFFRDPAMFEAVQKELLPKIIASRNSKRSLCIWSGAASSGQEAYSLAMMLRENFPQLLDWNVQICATDISDEMLARVASGEYSQFEVNRGLPAKMLIKYFERRGAIWRAKEELRKLIVCRKLNLTGLWPPLPQFDLVLMRNVLIYFDVPTKEQILARVKRSMAPDAMLILGGGETMLGMNAPFVRETIGKSACFRVS